MDSQPLHLATDSDRQRPAPHAPWVPPPAAAAASPAPEPSAPIRLPRHPPIVAMLPAALKVAVPDPRADLADWLRYAARTADVLSGLLTRLSEDSSDRLAKAQAWGCIGALELIFSGGMTASWANRTYFDGRLDPDAAVRNRAEIRWTGKVSYHAKAAANLLDEMSETYDDAVAFADVIEQVQAVDRYAHSIAATCLPSGAFGPCGAAPRFFAPPTTTPDFRAAWKAGTAS